MKNNTTTICTIFEGHYHNGVAALVNSLHAQGYEGIIWAAYKGALPPWAVIAETGDKGSIMHVTDTIDLHFVKLEADTFLPFSKPQTMLSVFEKYAPETQKLFYFDCDIVVKCRFSYFEEWVENGIAVCEDVNSPLPSTHPLRFQWKNYFKKYGIDVRLKDDSYINGGFVGLKRSAIGFLREWDSIQNMMLDDIKELKTLGLKDRTYLFHWTDQDGLNVVKDVTNEQFSIANSSAMDLRDFGYIMSHAVGYGKPWTRNWLKQVIKNGQRPSITDKLFMDYTQSPIRIFSTYTQTTKKLHLKFASALARFVV